VDKTISGLVRDIVPGPVLVDIGASGDPPKIWSRIAPQSVFVGFDPDLREMRETTGEGFSRSVIVNEAVVAHKGGGQAEFHFTKSPYCSSTLPPDTEALSDYLFSDLFEVEYTKMVPAVTLAEVVARLSLPGIDWLKADTQGTDLRIFTSLPEDIRSRVLALDIEPGLIDAYRGEDLMVDSHRHLTGDGFWLSEMNVGRAVRARRTTISELTPADPKVTLTTVQKAVRGSPAYCELRYLRTPAWLARSGATRREYLLLGVFALLDRKHAFVLDLCADYGKNFGEDAGSRRLRDAAIRGIKEGLRERRSISRKIRRLFIRKLDL